MNGWSHAASSQVLALVTTVHAGFLLLRHHRTGPSLRATLLLLPSAALSVSPWLLPQPLWLALGLLLHTLWFAACERLAPAQVEPRGTTGAGRPPAPAAQARSTSSASGFEQVPVLAVFAETDDLRTFRMARPPDFRFAAGQFLTVRVQVEGKPLVRCYSISSAPEASGYLEISVKRQGVVSSTLHSTVRPGTTLTIRSAAGGFTYPEGDDRPLVLLAGGVGITPLMSMLRHAILAEPSRPVTLFQAVKTERSVVFRHELDWICERYPHVRSIVTVSQGPVASGHSHGRLGEGLLRRHVPDLSSAIYMICGPQSMMDAMRGLLGSLGVPAAQIRQEAFAAAVAMSAQITPRDQPAHGTQRGPTHRLVLQTSGAVASVGEDETLLEAAEAAGADIPSSCRAGICMTCRTRLLDGEVECSSDSLDEDDRRGGYILPCVARARGDCALEA